MKKNKRNSSYINPERNYFNEDGISLIRQRIAVKLRNYLEKSGCIWTKNGKEKNDYTMLLLNITIPSSEIISGMVKLYIDEIHQIPKKFCNDKLTIVINFEEKNISDQSLKKKMVKKKKTIDKCISGQPNKSTLPKKANSL
uniref:DUF721 domain-containing protein n=1 Tax=Strongyloides venezuelensis TaxID=75913 RepID=A0A0K0FLK2_STRVS